MGEVFGETYAEVYDLLYEDKNYEAECDLIEKIFLKYAQTKPKNILDLGCGTGGHAIPLALRGYEVIGVDISSHMLSFAEQKAQKLREKGLQIQLIHGDIRNLNLGCSFDACICMFAVMCYQLSNDEVESVLKTVYEHLRKEGVFIFDFWYGPAVINIKPSQRIKIVKKNDLTIIRAAFPKLDVRHHINETTYMLWVLQDRKVIKHTVEKHKVRYFFPMEIEYFLQKTGLRLLDLKRFPEFDREPDEESWNAIAVAKPYK